MSATDLLCNNLALPEMIRKLQSRRVLDDGEVETIQGISDRPGRVDKLLYMLTVKPVQAFVHFMEALGTFDIELQYDVMELMQGTYMY